MHARALRNQVSVIGTGLQAGLLAVMLAVPGTLARDSSQATPAPPSGLERAVQSGLDAGLPGIALLVERNGERVASTAAGVTSVENQTPMTTEDRFRIYSIAKTFTATVVLQLVDEGILDLNDTVVDWLDDPAVNAIPNVERITLRQLLTHSSGIYDFADDNDSPFWSDAFLGPDADWTKVWTLPELLAYADGANHAPYFAPGEGWAYSNTGYLLLGMIMEAATGNAYGDELRARILEPLGLRNTTLAEGGAMPDDIVDGYHLVDGQRVNVSATNLSWVWTGGGMISTTEDLARFAQATFSGELLSPASFAEMFTFLPTDNPNKGEGMGVYSIATPNGTLIGMDGAGPGGESSMMHLPDADVTVVILANIAPVGAIVEGFRDEVFRLALAGRQAPLATSAVAQPPMPETPVGRQLAWVLAMLEDGASGLTTEEIGERFAPAFVAAIPPEQMVALTRGFADAFGPFTFAGFTRPPTEIQANALVTGANDVPIVIPVAVDDAPPHRITGMNFAPVPPPPGLPIEALTGDGATPASDSERIDGLFTVGDRQIYLSCSGSGSPTVILESGANDPAAPWFAIERAVAPLTRVCSYDRANTVGGASDPAPIPRTVGDSVADLHALLQEANVPGPYVLVGHSIGGLIGRLYASTFPEEVAGLVLVDASHEEQVSRLEALVSPEQWAAYAEMLDQIINAEGIDFEASFAEVREARVTAPLRPMPLVVVSAGAEDDPSLIPTFYPPGWPVEATAQLWQELQADMARLVPDGQHVIAERSGHYVHQSEPELVVEAIADVVEAVRDPALWASSNLATPVP